MDKEQEAAFEMLSRLVVAIEMAAQAYKARVLHAKEVGIDAGKG